MIEAKQLTIQPEKMNAQAIADSVLSFPSVPVSEIRNLPNAFIAMAVWKDYGARNTEPYKQGVADGRKAWGFSEHADD